MKTTLNTIKAWKKKSCKGQKGAYGKMRSACKRYVDAAGRKAKRGSKTKAKAEARKKALKIVNGGCRR